MLPLTVGYPCGPEAEGFAARLLDFADRVGEVYFAWPGEASGRQPAGGEAAEAYRQRFLRDLSGIRERGMALHLLFNANCYGADAVGPRLAERVRHVMTTMQSAVGLPDGITTASPAIAHILRHDFPDVAIRASVNMRIGTVAAMAMVADLFDEFCVQRDVNRDPAALRRLKAWADAHGKRLVLLANSGCLRHCPGQVFHDNLVAHDAADKPLERMDNFVPFVCWRHLRDPQHWQSILQATWIRPEDAHRYDSLAHGIKLATRIHPRPFQALRAYTEGRHRGDLLDLLEPGNGQFLGGRILDNRRFPPDWHEHATACPADGTCDRCESILRDVCVPAAEAV